MPQALIVPLAGHRSRAEVHTTQAREPLVLWCILQQVSGSGQGG